MLRLQYIPLLLGFYNYIFDCDSEVFYACYIHRLSQSHWFIQYDNILCSAQLEGRSLSSFPYICPTSSFLRTVPHTLNVRPYLNVLRLIMKTKRQKF